MNQLFTRIQGDSEYENSGRKIGLTEKIKDHREFLNWASGDSMQYFTIAIDEIENSKVPYVYRFFYPKIIGHISKIFTFESKESINYKDELFKFTSFLSRFLNLLSCILLLIIPLICFQSLFFRSKSSVLASLILTMNLVNPGNIISTSFFNLDLLNMVFFSLAAMFFYKKKILLYLITFCFGILIKEIAITLIIPFIFLLINENKINLLKKVIFFLIPVIIFFTIRIYFSKTVFGLNIGQTGATIELNALLKNGFSSFYYLKEVHFKSFEMFAIFLARSFFAIGFIILIAVYLRFELKINKEYFVVTSLVVLFLGIAVLLHASGVVRTIQIATPFIVFYSLSVIEKSLLIKNST